MRLIAAVAVAVLILGGTASAAGTATEVGDLTVNGMLGFSQFGGTVVVQPGHDTFVEDYGRNEVTNVGGVEPLTQVIATIQKGGRHVAVQSAFVRQNEYVVIRLTGAVKVPTTVAYLMYAER